jgi:hypothetical protein
MFSLQPVLSNPKSRTVGSRPAAGTAHRVRGDADETTIDIKTKEVRFG